MRVLLVEDEVRLAENLATALRDGPGFAVDWAEDGVAGDDFARTPCYDLIVLDLMLPKLDGYGVLRRMRARKDATPVLILTAKEGKEALVQLLNAGADDYLAKPFDLGELLAVAAFGREDAGDLLLAGGEHVDAEPLGLAHRVQGARAEVEADEHQRRGE